MTNKISYFKFTIILILLSLFSACQENEYEVKYSVTSHLNASPVELNFQNDKKTEQNLTEQTLPWSYTFNADKGDLVKVAANVYSNGGGGIIGTDTLSVIIYVNGIKFLDNKGIITNGVSEVVSISGTIQ
jgi:hypothetical protein